MTVVNPKSISGINSITTGSGSDNLLTIHTSDASSTERVRINSSGDVIVGSGITVSPDGDIFTTGVTTATTFVGALTGNVTGNISGGTVAGSTGTFTSHVSLGDSDELRLGAGNDLKLYHNGNNSFIEDAGTGDFYIRGADNVRIQSYSDNEDMAKFVKDGAVELYHNNSKKFETTSTGVSITSKLTLPDGAGNGIRIGDSADLQAYHDGSASWIYENGTGPLNIGTNNSNVKIMGGNSASDTMAEFKSTEGVELYYNNSKKFETYNSGVKVYSGHLRIVGDEGGESKLDLYADEGDDAYDAWQVKAGGSSDFYISGYNGSAFETAIKATGNGAVELYHDNSIRLQTTTNGVTAGGTIDTSQTAVVGAQAGFFGGAKSLFASATGLIQNQVCILDTATSAAAGTGGALTFAGYIDNDSTTYYATIEGVKENSSTNNYAGSLKFLTRSHNVANMNLAMVIDSSGDVIIGGTAVEAQAAITLEPNRDDGAGRITFNRANTSNVSVVIEMQNNNSQVGRIEHDHTGAALISGSDYRLKENDVAISDGITRVKQLRPIRFNWKSEPSQTVDGFFAHEISSIVPEAVSGEKDAVDSEGNIIMQGISKEKLVPLLTAALQEAIAKIETLETKVAALEG